jgi:hypothetical protein
MKTAIVFMTAVVALIGLSLVTSPSVMAQSPGHGSFSADHDGDGIPNCQDADYVKNPKDGTGYQHGKILQGQSMEAGQSDFGAQSRHNYKNRIRTEIRTQSCPGFFSGLFGWSWGNGTGDCDGTGPHGKRGGSK